MSYLE